MEIFHWVAHELKNEPLFSTDTYEEESDRIGAIYNDFDNQHPFPSDDETIQYHFSQPEIGNAFAGSHNENQTFSAEITPYSRDTIEIFFDAENFDSTSEYADKIYRRKVYNLLAKELHTLELSEEIVHTYEERKRQDWQGPDSVYDLWLLGQGEERTWFPIEIFEAEYPDYKELVNQAVDNYEKQSSSDQVETEEDFSDTEISSAQTQKRRRQPSESDSEAETNRVKIKREMNDFLQINSNESDVEESERFLPKFLVKGTIVLSD